MKKGRLLVLLILIIILTGCHSNPEPNKISFGKLSVTLPPFTPPTGSSNYPNWSLLWKLIGGNISKSTSIKQPRFIPPGTVALDFSLYNTTNMWVYSDVIPLQSTPVTYTLESIPTGSNYVLEVFSVFNGTNSMAIGRKTGITVEKDTINSVNLELLQPTVSNLALPAEVQGGQSFSVQGKVTMPIDLQTTTFLPMTSPSPLLDEKCSIILYFMSTSSSAPIGIIIIYEKTTYSFIANQPTDITIDDKTLYYALSETGELIPNAGPVPGTYILYVIAFPYEQPMTKDLYLIAWMPTEPITIQVN